MRCILCNSEFTERDSNICRSCALGILKQIKEMEKEGYVYGWL